MSKLMWCVQSKAITHAKFGVNMTKHGKDSASDAVRLHSSKCIDALNNNQFRYRQKMFLSAWSEDDLSQIL